MVDLNELRRKIKQGQADQVSVTREGTIKVKTAGSQTPQPGETRIPKATFHR